MLRHVRNCLMLLLYYYYYHENETLTVTRRIRSKSAFVLVAFVLDRQWTFCFYSKSIGLLSIGLDGQHGYRPTERPTYFAPKTSPRRPVVTVDGNWSSVPSCRRKWGSLYNTVNTPRKKIGAVAPSDSTVVWHERVKYWLRVAWHPTAQLGVGVCTAWMTAN